MNNAGSQACRHAGSKKIDEPGDSPLHSGCSLRLSFLTLLAFSTMPVPIRPLSNPRIFHSPLPSFTIRNRVPSY